MESKELGNNKDFSSIPLNLQNNEKDDGDNAIRNLPEASVPDKSLKKKTGSLKRFFSQRKMTTVTDSNNEIDPGNNESKRTTLSKRLGLSLSSMTNQKSKPKDELGPDAETTSKSKIGRPSTLSINSNRFRLQGYLSTYWNSVFKKTPVEVENVNKEQQSPRTNEQLNVDISDPIHTNPIAAIEEN